MLYTIIPYESIYANQSELNLSNPTIEWVEHRGKWVQIEKKNEQKKIVRLISTNPSDYLANEYQPGSLFE
jgi:hypothetical protein